MELSKTCQTDTDLMRLALERTVQHSLSQIPCYASFAFIFFLLYAWLCKW